MAKQIHVIVGINHNHGVENPQFACGTTRANSIGVKSLEQAGQCGGPVCESCVRAIFGTGFDYGLNAFARAVFAATIAHRVDVDPHVNLCRTALREHVALARKLFERAAEELKLVENNTIGRLGLAEYLAGAVSFVLANARTDLIAKYAVALQLAIDAVERRAWAEHGINTDDR